MIKNTILTLAVFCALATSAIFAQEAPSPTPGLATVASVETNRTQDISASVLSPKAQAEKEKLVRSYIIETARRIGYLKPADAVALVPSDLSDISQIEPLLRRTAAQNKSLVRPVDFCATDVPAENITYDAPGPLPLSALLSHLRSRFGVNFMPDRELADVMVQLNVTNEPWNVVLCQQLALLDIDASRIGNNAVVLVKRSKLLTLQESQRKSSPLVTEYIKLRYLRPQTGGQVDLSGKGAQSSRLETLESTIQKILTANGDSRGRIAQIPDRAEFFITATAEQFRQIKEVIAKADRPTYRVDVFGLVYTVNENKLRDVGSQFSAAINANGNIGGFSTLPTQQQGGTGTGSGSTSGSVIDGLPKGFTQPSGALGAGNSNSILGARVRVGSAEFAYQLSLLEQLGVARRVEKPFVSAKDGTTGTFENGTQIPVIIQSLNNFGSGAGGSISYIQAGTTLSVTPQVIEDENDQPKLVNLTLRLESNTPDLSITSSDGVPSVNSRRIQNEITIAPNQTFVYGGSNDQIDTNSVSRTPGLSKVPILKHFFKRDTKQFTDNKLYFAVWVQITLDDGISPIDADGINRTFVPPPPTDQPLTLPKKKNK